MALAKPVTNRERAEMRRLRGLHMSIGEIAGIVGRTERCVWTHVSDMPIAIPHGPKRWPADKVRRFLEAHGRREPSETLGPRFGLKPISVRPTACQLRKRMREAQP